MDREKAIEYIEGMTGLYEAIWHEWPDNMIAKLYAYVCVSEHGSVTLKDSVRVGVTL